MHFNSKRNDKPAIAKEVASLVRQQEPAGRFLRLDTSAGAWFEVSEHEAIKKTAQLLREGILQRQKKRKKNTVDPKIVTRSSPNLDPLKKRRPAIQVMRAPNMLRSANHHVLLPSIIIATRDMNREQLTESICPHHFI